MTDCPFDTRLARTSYLVIPKLALQAMPMEWRQRFDAMLDEADATGLRSPRYHVFRDDPAFTRVERYDPDDDYSPIAAVRVHDEDPWSNYRYGDAMALSRPA